MANNPGVCIHITDQLVNLLFNLSLHHLHRLKDEAVLNFLGNLLSSLEAKDAVHQRILLKTILILTK